MYSGRGACPVGHDGARKGHDRRRASATRGAPGREGLGCSRRALPSCGHFRRRRELRRTFRIPWGGEGSRAGASSGARRDLRVRRQGGGDRGFGGALDGARGMRARRERDDAAGAPAGPRPVAGGERLGGPVGRRGRRGVRALRLGDPHPNGSPCGHQRHDRLGLGAAGRSRAGRSVRPAQPCLGEEHAANGSLCGVGGLGGGQRGHAPGHGGDGRLLPG